MNYDDVLGNVKELLALYQSGEDGRNSDRAQELRVLLAEAFPADIERATKFIARYNIKSRDVIENIQNSIQITRRKQEESALSDVNATPASQEKPAEQETTAPTRSKKNKTEKESSVLGKGQQAVLATLAEYASETGIDLTTVTRGNYQDVVDRLEAVQEKAIAKDIHDYLTGKVDDYSDRVADYLVADGLSPSKQRYHWTKTLSILRSEFATRPQSKEERINRNLLMEMTLNVYQSSKAKSTAEPKVPEPRVAERTEGLLEQMAKVGRSDYKKRLENSKGRFLPKDQFLADLKNNTHNDPDFIPLTEKIAAAHVQKMLEQLEPEAQSKYIASLRKNDLSGYIPEGYTPRKKEHTTEQNNRENPHKEGDRTMAEENKNTEDNTQPIEQPAEENTFTPTAIQQKACEYAGIDWKKFKDNDSISAAIESAGLVISGANIIDLKMEDIVATVEPETEEQKKEAEEFKKNKEFAERDEGVDMADLPSKKELNVSAITEEAEHTNNGPTQDNEPVQDDWITRKAIYYKGLSDNNLIKDYARDETVQNGFAASFNNAQIRYSSPSSVSISQTAGLEVFDAMLKEPDNKGRKVNFAEDMPPAMAARLYAACLINGNEMGGNVPQLTDEQLKEALGNEEYAAFQQKMAEKANSQPETPSQEAPNQEEQRNSGPTLDTLKDKNIEISRENNNPSQIDLVAKDANGQTTFEFHGELKDFYETKENYSAKSGENLFDNKGGDNQPLPEADRQFIAEKIRDFMLKEALMDQYKMAKMEASGKIVKSRTGDSENAMAVTLKGEDCTDAEYEEYRAMEARASHGKSFLAKEFEKDPSKVREAAGNIIRDIASGKTTEMSVSDVREAQIKAVREKMAQNKTDGNSDTLMDHDKKILALSGRLPAGEKAYVTKGGEKQEVKALEGDAKTRFEARNKDAIDRALKNYQSRVKG